MSTNENLKYDVRVRERLVAKGVLSEDDVTKYLEALPDVAAESEAVDLSQPAIAGGGEPPAPAELETPAVVAAPTPMGTPEPS